MKKKINQPQKTSKRGSSSARHVQPSLMSIQEKLGMFKNLVKRSEEEENARQEFLNRKPLSFM